MKLSQWKTLFRELIDGVQSEVGMPIPALEEFRKRIEAAAPIPEKRKAFEDEIEVFLDSQPFLREAASRHLGAKAAQAIESGAALLERVRQVFPEDDIAEDETTKAEESAEETTKAAQLEIIDVWDAIERAEEILPGRAAAEGKSDPRWQAIMKIEDFIEEEPDAIWPFIVRWGSSIDEDLRAAIATCLLEDLLEHHFARFFRRVEDAVRKDPLFAKTFLVCWKLGQATESGNFERFDALRAECQRSRRQK
jgi:hypothetical protein